MYGKLNKNGNITFYNGFYIDHEDQTITNPDDATLRAAGYKPVVGNGYIINSTNSKLVVTYTEEADRILMVHRTESGDYGELPQEEEDDFFG